MMNALAQTGAEPENAGGQIAGAMVWLLAGVIIAAVGIWYPVSVDRQFGPEIDTGIGVLCVYGIQFVLAATVSAGFALRRLYRGSRYLRPALRGLVMGAGVALALATSSPIFAVGIAAVRSLAWGIAHPDG